MSERPATPFASVVMPVFGAREWADRAIRALQQGTPAGEYELIVVDNASPDGAAAWLGARHPDVHVVRNADNLGFGVASNQGAALGRGEIVVFLNSDALVHEGWLDPLRRELADPTVGAAGPMFLNLDGAVQEAGAMCWREGNTHQFAVGRDPDDPGVTFPRTVDYVSAACLAFRAADFWAAGGFDPAFHLAYCEDVDLCLRLAAVGLRTRYVPGATVMHKAGASRDADLALRLFRRNRHLIVARHAVALAGRPAFAAPASPARLALIRDAIAHARILVAGDDEAQRAARTLQVAWPDARVTLLGPVDDPARRDLNADGVEVVAAADGGPWLAARRFQLDLVVGTGGVDDDAWTRLVTDQPQAVVARADPVDTDALVRMLGLPVAARSLVD